MLATLRGDERAAWAVPMVLFMLTTAVESLSWSQLSAFTPLYLAELGVRPAQVAGWTASMTSLGWLLALPLAPFWGVWADRYSRKAVIVRSAVFEALIFAGWAFAPNPWVALAFRCLNGFVLGNTGVMLAVQATATPAQRIGLAVGFVTAGPPFGRAFGPALGSLLIHFVDVRGMLVFDAGLSALMAVALVLVLDEAPRTRPVGISVLGQLREAVGEITAHPVVRRLFVAMAVAQVGTWMVLPFVPIVVAHRSRGELGDLTTAVGLAASISALAGAAGAPLWGRMVDRHGTRRVLAVAASGACASLLAAAWLPQLPALVAAMSGFSFFSIAIATTVMALLARVVTPERRGAVLGQVLFPTYVAGLVGPALGAAAITRGDSALFALAGLASLAPIALLGRGTR